MQGKTKYIGWLLCVLFLLAVSCTAAMGKVIYVDVDAVSKFDGSSWEHGYRCLQDAIAEVQPGDEIRVAEGVYKPDRRLEVSGRAGAQVTASGDWTATFELIEGVTMKGGYAGHGKSDPDARDIELYETVLSGDLYGNDIDVNDPGDLWEAPCRTENSYHVVTSRGLVEDAVAVLDGITISGGNANEPSYVNGNGGGLYNQRCTVRITNCTFTRNSSLFDGGGIYNNQGDLSLTNCKFTENLAGSGGGAGIYNYKSNLKQNNCTFIRNLTQYGEGGGINNDECDSNLANCIFIENSARAGGGIYNRYSSPTLTNCVFRSNLADGLDTQGGGMYNINCSLELTNSMFSENSAEIGGAICNKDSNTVLNMCEFVRNKASYYGGAIANGGQLIAKVCVFKNNYPGAVKDGGSESVPTFIDCIFSGNSSIYPGGAVSVKTATFYNCLFIGNRAFGDWSTGGAVYSILTASLNNCTFSNNWADNGRALYCYRASVDNCIFWGTEGQIYPDSPEGELVFVDYSNIQGGWSGEGNIDTDPCFVDPGYWANVNDPNIIAEPNDPNAIWVDGDYHLKSQAGRWDPVSESWVFDDVTSPCIDAGDPNSPVAFEPFPNGGIINMGAYGGTAEASMSFLTDGDNKGTNSNNNGGN